MSLDGQVMAEYNMTKERYTVGRLPDNDVRIDNAAVSGHHGLIINILNDSFLEDLNSTNGTYVNGKLIKKHALTHGDVITIGHHHLRFVDSQVEDTDQDEFERTLVIQPGQVSEARLRAATESLDAPAAQPAPQAPAAPAPRAAAPPAADKSAPSRAAKLQVLSGQFAGRELELAKTLTTLGRPGVQVAAISRRADGYYVVHVESSKPGDYPLVNGQPIGPQARRLHDNDVVTLAGVKMGFFEA
ncbi:MAG TPA: FHA domain-containing protein [Steroidobacteraceae bacterium]|nr:FHA domain-containing protein [Steroidobacteraceae bacterium]